VDATDAAILHELKQNARASAAEIGKRVALSAPAVAERIRKLERAGVIAQYTVRLDRAKCGSPLLAFLLVRIEGTRHAQAFRGAAAALPGVLECHHVTGTYDYLLKVTAADTLGLEHFITRELKTIPGVAATNTMLALATLKEEFNA